jgi:hypothetical protein
VLLRSGPSHVDSEMVKNGKAKQISSTANDPDVATDAACSGVRLDAMTRR